MLKITLLIARNKSEKKYKLVDLRSDKLTMHAEYVLPSFVPFQQPPLFSSHLNAPEAGRPKRMYE